MLTASEIAELDRRIAVMQAYLDGRKVEWSIAGSVGEDCWSTNFGAGTPQWDWNHMNYRIAPEPRKPHEITLVYDSGQWRIAFMRNFRPTSYTSGDAIELREVLPD